MIRARSHLLPEVRLVTRLAFAWSRFALVTWLATWAATVVALALHGRVAAWQVWIGLACGALALYDRRLTPLQRVAALVSAVAFSAFALAMSVLLPDLTFDANLYHLPGALALADGWNPLWDRWGAVVAQTVSINAAEIVRCYPKGVWSWFGAVYTWIGNVDAGKALSFWLVLAPAGPAFAYFRTMTRQPTALSVFATLLVCANPVALTQITTGYIDIHVSALVTTILFSALLATGKRWRSAANLAAMASALLIGAKFTGLVYACVFPAVMVGWALCRRRWPGAYVWRTALGIVLGVLLAFDSYGLNTHAYGNPFHPAWQPGVLTVLDSQAAPAFQQRNRVDRLVRALGAPQTDEEIEHRVDPPIRWPFTEVRWKPRHDARFSGFGPVFWEALLLSLLALCARRRAASVAALAAVLGTTLATDAGWWPRLAPQVWLLPMLIVMSGPPRSRLAGTALRRWHAWTVLLLLAGNLAVVSEGAAHRALDASNWWSYRALSLDTTPNASLTHEDLYRSLQRRLQDLKLANGIPLDAGPPLYKRPPTLRERLALGLGLRDHR